MATELTKAENNALSVSYEVLGQKVELDIDFVKKFLVHGKAELLSDQEVVFFMNTCKAQKLNPLVNGEVYLIKYSPSDNAQLVVGKGAYMRRAYEHPEYIGKEDGIVVERNGATVKKEGCCPYPGETLIGGWCRVYYNRSGTVRSAYKEVSLSEYDKGQSNWKSKPATMINKVAISQCVREAFPKDYEGLYSEDEMIASGAIRADIPEVDPSTGEVVGEPVDILITREQAKEMMALGEKLFGKENNQKELTALWKKHGYEGLSKSMPVSVFNGVMEEIDAMLKDKQECQKAAEIQDAVFVDIPSENETDDE